MNCREFEDRIEILAVKTAASAEARVLAEHAAGCARCARMLSIVRGEADPLPPEVNVSLTEAIMARTAGHACNVAQERLCDWLEGKGEVEEQRLISLHIAHCTSCGDLADTLAEIGDILPTMAEVEPGPDFTAEVMKATAQTVQGRILRRPEPPSPAVLWRRIIRRPRFVWEAAYVGALVFLLLLGQPAIRTRALSWPQRAVVLCDQWMHQAGEVLSAQEQAARQSFDHIEVRRKSLFKAAAGMPARATASLHGKVLLLIEEWKSHMPPESSRELR